MTEGTSYSPYMYWDKASEETRTLFRELEEEVEPFGSVRADLLPNQISLKYMGATSRRERVVAHIQLRTKSVGLSVQVLERRISDIPLERGFTRLIDHDRYRSFTILNREHIRKARPLLHTAYHSISSSVRGC